MVHHCRFDDYSHRLPNSWLANGEDGTSHIQILESRGRGVAKGQPRLERERGFEGRREREREREKDIWFFEHA